MFGYVTCEKAELKVKDYERYSGYYCGVCKSIARRYGQLPRLVLSYDAAFLALLLAGLLDIPEVFLEATKDAPEASQEETVCRIRREHCIAHPLQKKVVLEEAAVDYAADVLLLLAYYKMEDDRRDEGGVKAITVERFLRSARRKIATTRPELATEVATQIKRQTALENAHCASVDEAADPTGKIMSAVLQEGQRSLLADSAASKERGTSGTAKIAADCATSVAGNKTDAKQRVLEQLGYQMGRWIYLVDAADDLTEDLATGDYNPFAYRFEDRLEELPASADQEDFSRAIHNDVERILLSCTKGIGDALALLELRRNQAIIENVVYLGMLRQTDRVLAKLRGEDPDTERKHIVGKSL